MPVFAILAHSQPEMVRKLVDALAPHSVVMHVDKKSDLNLFKHLPRTEFVTDREDVRWGGMSIVKATIKLFERAIQIAKPGEHIVVLSGQCYPVAPIEKFVGHLEATTAKQHCKAALVFDGSDYSEQRLSRQWYFEQIPLNRNSRLRKPVSAVRYILTWASPRKSATDFEPYRPVAGSQWIALTKECISDILPTAKSDEFQLMFKHSLAPDEIFFHTLVYNSRWLQQVADPQLRLRGMRRTAEFANFHFIDPSLSLDLTLDDLPRVQASQAYFARKFTLPGSADLIDALKCSAL